MATYFWRCCNKREDTSFGPTSLTIREPSHAPIWIWIVILSPQILALNGFTIPASLLQWQPIFGGAIISVRITIDAEMLQYHLLGNIIHFRAHCKAHSNNY